MRMNVFINSAYKYYKFVAENAISCFTKRNLFELVRVADAVAIDERRRLQSIIYLRWHFQPAVRTYEANNPTA